MGAGPCRRVGRTVSEDAFGSFESQRAGEAAPSRTSESVNREPVRSVEWTGPRGPARGCGFRGGGGSRRHHRSFRGLGGPASGSLRGPVCARAPLSCSASRISRAGPYCGESTFAMGHFWLAAGENRKVFANLLIHCLALPSD